MERLVSPAPVHADGRCVACQGDVVEDRCGHCGAAARVGPYSVLKLLSQNTQGRVYLAADGAGAQVALKELVYTMVPSVTELEAFGRETELLAQLSHPRIPRFVRGFTVGQGAHTRLYLAQELVRGESLEQRLAHHRFNEDEVNDIARQVLDVLAWLNDRSPPIVHRDLKPANLIISPEGQVHLIDFGTARDVKAGGTHRSTLVGTVGYAAPEQLGGTVSHQSDLYGLGATLVHLLTRKSPEQFVGASLAIDVTKLDVSPQMRQFLRGLLAPRSADRFADARAALKALRDGSGISPVRQPSSQRFLVAAGLAGLLAAATGLMAFQRSRAATETAEAALPRAQQPAVEAAPVELPPLGAQPVVKLTSYAWEVAKWEFGKPGPWIVDTTGHRHSAPFPPTGYSLDFFGPIFDGTAKVRVPDSPQFAFTGPFTVEVRIGRAEQRDPKNAVKEAGPPRAEHLVTRGDPDGRFAWDLALIGDSLRFSLMDSNGKTSVIEGAASFKEVHSTYYAVFNPKTGEQQLFRLGQCAPVARAVTDVRPAREVPSGEVRLIDGFRGRVDSVNLTRGLELPTGESADGQCSMSGSLLDE